MPNTAEYKNYLFVKVPEDASGFKIWLPYKIGNTSFEGGLGYDVPENVWDETVLPPGSWQIIGKGDAIDWEGIIAHAEITDPRGHQVTAKESGYSVLRSLGMEPGTTLVLKKNEK